jgi:DNA modification methylase
LNHPDPHPNLFREESSPAAEGPVKCLGLTFETDAARRAYFLERLRQKLHDPEFRCIEGFPIGSDEDILALSDPPYYTACPNPFLEEFVRHYGKPYDPETDDYHREPLAVDVSEGKTDPLYAAHAYYTKVPYRAIVPAILHYTEPGDLILDGFAGSGMTGVAAQMCDNPDPELRRMLEIQRREQGLGNPCWGPRRAVLNDLAPAATMIAAGYNLPFNIHDFVAAGRRLLKEVEDELGWMYETLHSDGKSIGRINFTVWSEIFACPECSEELVLLEEVLDKDTKRIHKTFSCPRCRAELSKDRLQRLFETTPDPDSGEPWEHVRFELVLLNYTVDGHVYEKAPDTSDMDRLERIRKMGLPFGVPTNAFPFDNMWEAPRLKLRGITRVHHLFLPRAVQAIAALWSRANQFPDYQLRRMILFLVDQAIWGMSLLARYAPTHYSQVNQYLSGAYYVGSQIVEVSPWYILDGKLTRLSKAFSSSHPVPGDCTITTGDCAIIPLPDACIDYVFTDPPFGDNFPYAELNFLVESWYGVLTDPNPEAIVDRVKANRASQKSLINYQDLMRRCFEEYYRALKPGRWLTVVFSNSKNSVWRAIQEGLGTAGFVIADVRTLDKQQGSFRQLTSAAVKQDLVIAAYKPTEGLSRRFQLGSASLEDAWAFVREHLRNVPPFVAQAGRADIIAERTPQMLLDRMTAFHVQHGLAVPLSSGEFLIGLAQRFPERDGMYFLTEQVAEYDRKRMAVRELRQLEVFISDESSAIQWVRRQLQDRPQRSQDLQPQFMRETQACTWAKHEQTLELRTILEQNFLCYDGKGPIPEPIWTWMQKSSVLRVQMDGESRETANARLHAEGKDRWYVPDPNRAGDLEKLRERALLREFEEYRASRQRRLRVFRLEAVRAGFRRAWQERDYSTILEVAARIPEDVLQEDPKLLMWYDQAVTRTEQEA